MDSLSSSLSSLSSTPTNSRASSYNDLLKSLLSQPRSSLDSNTLQSCISKYLDVAAFSDLNSAGGGLVVGRQVLNDFLSQIKAATKSQAGVAAIQEGSQDADTEMKTAVGEKEEEGDHVPAIKDLETMISVLQNAIDKTSTKVLSFEEQVS